jgi:hypothetical protein
LTPLLAFGSLVSLAAEIGSGCAGLGEEAREDRLEDRSENDLGTTGGGKSHPEHKNELEGVVEC